MFSIKLLAVRSKPAALVYGC